MECYPVQRGASLSSGQEQGADLSLVADALGTRGFMSRALQSASSLKAHVNEFPYTSSLSRNASDRQRINPRSYSIPRQHPTLLGLFMTCTVVATLFSSVQAQNFTVAGPPKPHQCVPFTFNVTGGQAPYTLTVSHFGQSNTTPPVAIFPNLTGHLWHLLVNVTGGTSLQGAMVDSSNHRANTGKFVVISTANSSTSCLSTESSTESSSSSTATATNESSSSPSESSTPLSSGAIAGVAIAAALIAAAALALGLYLLRKHKKRRSSEKPFIEDLDPSITQFLPTTETPRPQRSKRSSALAHRTVGSGSGPSSTLPAYGYMEHGVEGLRTSGTSLDASPRMMLPGDVSSHEPESLPASRDGTFMEVAQNAPAFTVSNPRRMSSSDHELPRRPGTGDSGSAPSRSSKPRNPSALRNATIPGEAEDGQTSEPRQEADGGVRLAGGPLDDMSPDDGAVTLPPPYQVYSA